MRIFPVTHLRSSVTAKSILAMTMLGAFRLDRASTRMVVSIAMKVRRLQTTLRTGAVLGAVTIVALAVIRPLSAMPHDTAEARGCKPRIEGRASFACPASSSRPCDARQVGRMRAVAAWQEQALGLHGDKFAKWSYGYLRRLRIEGEGGNWTYIVSAYPCPTHLL